MLEVRKGTILDHTRDGQETHADWLTTGRRCWFVRVVAEDGAAAIPMEFAREVDAKIAMQSLLEIDDWNGTLPEIAARMQEYTKKELQRLMVRDLQW